jgi:peptidoglycan/xylan/chitin deacetylase (PgdA/CDA1 family)
MNTLLTLRAVLKRATLAVLYYSGVMWLFAAARLRGRMVVLTYHRVLPADSQSDSHSSPAIIVRPQTFDRHMRFVRKYLRPLSLAQFIETLESPGPWPGRSCLVTFDDGWQDTLTHALPVLRRHGVPAVLFAAIDYIGSGKCFWQERLSAALHRCWAAGRPHALATELQRQLGLPEGPLAKRASIRTVIDALKRRPPAEIEEWTRRLEQACGTLDAVGTDRFLSWPEVVELVRSGLVSMGSHAMSHRPLTRLPMDEVSRELSTSRACLKEKLGVDADAIAYPNGDTDDHVAALAAAAGFRVGFSTTRGLVERGSPYLQLRRVNIHEAASTTRPAFLARLIGLA